VPRFCSSCGGRIGAVAPVSCPACGAQHWPQMSSAAGAMIVHDGRLLMQRRAIEPWLGAWSVPGGFCDEGEDVEAAAVREAYEEAGVRIELTGYVGHWVDLYRPGTDEGDDPTYCCVSYFHARVLGPPELRIDSESDDVGWFAPDELPRPLAPSGNGEKIYAVWRQAMYG
jgi:ADP-ribose pyrophosphatase YjhB (NUDIX family)